MAWNKTFDTNISTAFITNANNKVQIVKEAEVTAHAIQVLGNKFKEGIVAVIELTKKIKSIMVLNNYQKTSCQHNVNSIIKSTYINI